MTCRDCTTFLADYVAGELAVDARVTFETHLDACPNCQVFLVQYRETIVAGKMAMGDEGAAAIPPELVRAILKALDKD
jgi:anti-sigma factor RsiW